MASAGCVARVGAGDQPAADVAALGDLVELEDPAADEVALVVVGLLDDPVGVVQHQEPAVSSGVDAAGLGGVVVHVQVDDPGRLGERARVAVRA